MLGLGSILGTGVFVSIGIGASVAGTGVILAVVLASLVATANGLSSAQLAASYPVSGGTYEYGYKTLNGWWGFAAGWMFLCAKSASAATAALGFAGYALGLFGISSPSWRVGIALIAVAILTGILLQGIRRSSSTNTIIVSVTLLALGFFIVAGLMHMLPVKRDYFVPMFGPSVEGGEGIHLILNATALMFVAYTGYGRVATLGEEVKTPSITIPRAIIGTLIVSLLLYLGVAVVAIGNVGTRTFADMTLATSAPLEYIASAFAVPGAGQILAAGAISAMLGVLLNLLLGLSRVLLAMGRRGDMPPAVARVNRTSGTPVVALVVMAVVIAGLVLSGDIRTTWTFSAFTVLVYYAVTNLAALNLPPKQRRYPRAIAIFGLMACGFLAFWVPLGVMAAGLGLLGVGFAWRFLYRKYR